MSFMTNFSNCYQRFVITSEQINNEVETDPKTFIDVVEEAYHHSVRKVAKQVVESGNCKIIMLAGPSSSGKTTTAKMLQDAINALGMHTVMISMDDFYLGDARLPIGPNGKRDYENVNALDIELLKKCLRGLINDGHCMMPRFNFNAGAPFDELVSVDLPEGSVAIIEGIHALNPIFTEEFHGHGLMKLYVSVKQGITSENGDVLSASEVRFIRRLVRDFYTRNSSAERTLSMWDDVCDGEQKYIMPFKRTSDFTINTIHVYEPCIIGYMALPILSTVEPSSTYYPFAQKMIHAIEQFSQLSDELVPKTSLIREFIGGGIYKY